MKPKIIAIIPARGGSKGIPRKNIKLLAGKPLISYSIQNALNSKYIEKVVVSTDDDEISYVSELYGAEVIKRPRKLAGDDITLDPVINHALNCIENVEKKKYDFAITLQPTSPLLKAETIDTAIELILNEEFDTLISVKADHHLCWTKKDGHFTPLYKERKNRQYLDPIYRETGSFLISKRNSISEHNRIGEKLSLFEVPSEESIDIDTYEDWMIAENSLERKKIVFRVDGDSEIGLGHVYRTITLASRLAFKNEVLFLMDENKRAGVEKVSSSNFTIVTFDNDENLFEKLEQINPDIIINDILDTNTDYVTKLKSMGHFVVNFEDLGEGSEHANIVINSLYEHSYPPENHYFGHKYVCLRDEFYLVPTKKTNESVQNIMITFGGTDPSNLTLRTLKSIKSLNFKDVGVTVIMGLGYGPKEELYAYVDQLLKEGFHITVKENVNMMAKEIFNTDIVLTSNGRTIYEITSIGTPFISISQNERESRHLFVHYLKGIMYLGMEYAVSEADIASAIKELIENYDLRKKINENLLKADLKGGMDRTLRLIFDKYKEWDENESIKF
ncbi:hypothetical protein LI82_11845 [Methanococcoides methylutens]|uniref:Cytidyltransferase n=1 Tax=Methanococcoides methylutens TaxID=2226 RepID=A0A099SZQ4_METMT|nr:2-C-methyl-D-erythritol 4-phosphate cytidylyltransferase [Methanococcoides methylutens]KGK98390.1 hypothetical protein LI82_11845 [Methanococcoides methylutens]